MPRKAHRLEPVLEPSLGQQLELAWGSFLHSSPLEFPSRSLQRLVAELVLFWEVLLELLPALQVDGQLNASKPTKFDFPRQCSQSDRLE
mmetsp:Transcript_29682/g.61215  ORF Transcript_29682/g.61215 Transcript_29682/m.61215 type:complete len:89 (+) Transcript_29682:753-1019(+)